MSEQSTFSLSKVKLLEVLKRLKKLTRSAKKKDSVLEITVIDKYVVFNIPGVELRLPSQTLGSVKFTVGLGYILSVVDGFSDESLYFTVTENQVKIKPLSFNAPTTFFNDVFILRSIQLPVNYNFLDLISLQFSQKYTLEEIRFNKLDLQVEDAIQQLKVDIEHIAHIANKYNISRKEMEAFIVSIIKERQLI
jgi:hypothetical protein